ncbi:MAG: type II secretion system protein GspM [Burkholderiaceae bacterium]
MTPPDNPQAELVRRYGALAPRERMMLGVMAAALAFLAAWMLLVRPAWNTLAQAPAQRARADLQLLQMQALAAEAKELRALPPVAPAQAEQVLKAATDQLGGKGRLSVQNDRATLSLAGATGEDLRQWLIQARGGARARPVEASLTRAGDGYKGTLTVVIGSP